MIPEFQKPFRLDRINSRGGGVAVYMRDGLAVEKLSLPSANIECTGLRVRLPKRKKVMLFTVYRPPQTVIEPFLQYLELVLYPYLKHTLWLVGDFNAKNSAWWSSQSTDSQGEALELCADSLNLHQNHTETNLQCIIRHRVVARLNVHKFTTISSLILHAAADCGSLCSRRTPVKKSRQPKPYRCKIFIERKFKTKAWKRHVVKNPWRSPGSNLRHQIA